MIPPVKDAVAYVPSGYRMIDSIEIENFRGYENARVENCRRINVIVGENGSGKTALLEAIFMAAGANPELALRLRNWRGIEATRIHGTQDQIWEALFEDLFFNFDMGRSPKISLKGSTGFSRALTIAYGGATKSVSLTGGHETEEGRVLFKYKTPRGREITLRPRLEDGEFKFPPSDHPHIESSFFPANRAPSASETANRFSVLSRTLRKQEFMEHFAQHFPDIVDITVESLIGSAVLYAQVKGLPQRIPFLCHTRNGDCRRQ